MAMHAEWIAVDWGTTNLRVWVIGADGQLEGVLACSTLTHES
jgi:2-keto-3-deoxy-galactonokinase